jgi:hypothetical protein
MERRLVAVAQHVHAIEDERVQVQIEIETRPAGMRRAHAPTVHVRRVRWPGVLHHRDELLHERVPHPPQCRDVVRERVPPRLGQRHHEMTHRHAREDLEDRPDLAEPPRAAAALRCTGEAHAVFPPAAGAVQLHRPRAAPGG